MDDRHLNATLKAYNERLIPYLLGPAARSGKVPVLTAQAQAAIEKLLVEARRVRDPGGPISNYGKALDEWATENHPDIDDAEMFRHVINKLLFDAR